MNLRFNIIYTPGTVKYLRLLLFSLLKWSDCSFRLMPNGCSQEEVGLLRRLCAGNSRLHLMVPPWKEMVPHHQALNYLQAAEDSDYFSLIDSDVLATGDFSRELGSYLGHYAGLFSGSDIWCKRRDQILPEGLTMVPSRYLMTDTGICLGSTHFAVYDNRLLSRFVQGTGVDFRAFRWVDLEPRWQSRISEMGLRRMSYDTGKVLNLLLQAMGERLCLVESASLRHIGGFSVLAAYRQGLLPHSRLLARMKRRLRDAAAWAVWMTKRKDRHSTVGADEVLVRSNAACSTYFTNLLRSLFEGREWPKPPRMHDPEIQVSIEMTAREIVDLYREVRDELG